MTGTISHEDIVMACGNLGVLDTAVIDMVIEASENAKRVMTLICFMCEGRVAPLIKEGKLCFEIVRN